MYTVCLSTQLSLYFLSYEFSFLESLQYIKSFVEDNLEQHYTYKSIILNVELLPIAQIYQIMYWLVLTVIVLNKVFR